MASNDASATTASRCPGTRRETATDPWGTAAAERPSEQSGWLLSYLDVMTLLFSFFVVLFAYQKALTAESKTARAETAEKSETIAAPMPVTVTPAVIAVSKTITANRDSAASSIEKSTDESRPAKTGIKLYPAYPMQTRVVSSETEDKAERSGEPHPAVPENSWIADIGDSAANAAALLGKAFSDADLSGSVEISATGGEVRLEINDTILFDPARTELKPEGAEVLDRLADALGARDGTIAVEGHTDDRPIATARYRSNWELSTARASTVTRYLIAHGVAPERLRAVGLADTQPRETNHTPEGRARNRRVSVVIFLPRENGLRT
ncbi:OmpA/MotB domain protein [Methylocaldum marinum]|uniref:OmpA/MotB domain protein n=1 Tax=Methylocaldum marinum TaxID=1432792 RepID=A0A250KTV6_9GAMM|nr:OmpA family protein [Methylocaldum marinum]BBA35002.1 OmpA/MotB domain protein [Methylocaldum marinum]